MLILVCGSRDWGDIGKIREVLSFYEDESPSIIHGGARGADLQAADIALGLGYRVFAYAADWERYGKAAGPKRNLEMLDQEPDLVIAFWNGKSRGTLHTITEAKARNISVKVYGNNE